MQEQERERELELFTCIQPLEPFFVPREHPFFMYKHMIQFPFVFNYPFNLPIMDSYFPLLRN